MPPFCGNLSLQQVLNQINLKLTALGAAGVDLSLITTNLDGLSLQMSNYNLERQMQLSAAEVVLLAAIEAIPSTDMSEVMAALTDIQANTPTDLSVLQATVNTIKTNTSGLAAQIAALQTKVDALSTTPTPTTPTAVLELKFNTNTYTDLAGTVAATTNDYVRSWRSTVGGHLFTQATDAARPQRQSDGLYFDGGDGLAMNMVDAFNWGTGDFTFSFWAMPTSSTSPVMIISQNPGSFGALVFRSDSAILIANSAGAWVTIGGINFGTIPTTWTHYAMVRDAGTFRGYKNGVQIGTVVSSAAMLFSTAYPFMIGQYWSTIFYTGKYNDIRLYTSCLYPNGTTFTPPTRST
jgi:hypothetical protein